VLVPSGSSTEEKEAAHIPQNNQFQHLQFNKQVKIQKCLKFGSYHHPKLNINALNSDS